MTFTSDALDTFFSQNISQLTKCDAPDLSAEFDQAEYWVRNFILNSIFRIKIELKLKPILFGILRRAQMGIVEYQNGQVALLEYVSGPKDSVSKYFRALSHFELAVMMIYQGFEFQMCATEKPLFMRGDGTPLERTNRIYNVSKHLELSSIPEGYTHAVWLTNEGINVSDAMLTWVELAELARDLAKGADQISNLAPPSASNGQS